jgi:hypothetical protein
LKGKLVTTTVERVWVRADTIRKNSLAALRPSSEHPASSACLLARGGIRDRGERDQAGPLLRVGLVDAPARGAVHPDIGDGVQPLADLSPEVVPGREGPSPEEVLLEVEAALDLAAPLLVSEPADDGLEPVVVREGQEVGCQRGWPGTRPSVIAV